MAVWFHYFPVSCRTGATRRGVGCLTRYWRGCELYAGCQSSSRSSSQPHLLLIKQFQACSAIPGPTLFPLIINDICVPVAHENESNVVIVGWGREHIKGTLYLVRWSCRSNRRSSKMIRCCLIAYLHTAFLEVKYLSHSLRLFPWIRRLADMWPRVSSDQFSTRTSLSLSLFLCLYRSPFPLLLFSPSIPSLTSEPGSGILGTFFHVKHRAPVEGCDATALFQPAKRGTARDEAKSCPLQKNSHFLTLASFLAGQLKTIPSL